MEQFTSLIAGKELTKEQLDYILNSFVDEKKTRKQNKILFNIKKLFKEIMDMLTYVRGTVKCGSSNREEPEMRISHGVGIYSSDEVMIYKFQMEVNTPVWNEGSRKQYEHKIMHLHELLTQHDNKLYIMWKPTPVPSVSGGNLGRIDTNHEYTKHIFATKLTIYTEHELNKMYNININDFIIPKEEYNNSNVHLPLQYGATNLGTLYTYTMYTYTMYTEAYRKLFDNLNFVDVLTLNKYLEFERFMKMYKNK